LPHLQPTELFEARRKHHVGKIPLDHFEIRLQKKVLGEKRSFDMMDKYKFSSVNDVSQ